MRLTEEHFLKMKEWDEQATASKHPGRQVCRPIGPEDIKNMAGDIANKLQLARFNGALLDVGCGNSFVAAYLDIPRENITGVDYSSEMVRLARRLSPRSRFFRREANNLVFPDNQFDRVLCYSIFHYFPDDDYSQSVIAELIRVAKPGGIILIGDVPDKRHEKEFKLASNPDYEKAIPLIQRYSKWRFFDLESWRENLAQKGHRCEILSQPKSLICSSYRKDFRIFT